MVISWLGRSWALSLCLSRLPGSEPPVVGPSPPLAEMRRGKWRCRMTPEVKTPTVVVDDPSLTTDNTDGSAASSGTRLRALAIGRQHSPPSRVVQVTEKQTSGNKSQPKNLSPQQTQSAGTSRDAEPVSWPAAGSRCHCSLLAGEPVCNPIWSKPHRLVRPELLGRCTITRYPPG